MGFVTVFFLLFNILSVAILMISSDTNPATNAVVVARAGTIRPAIYQNYK